MSAIARLAAAVVALTSVTDSAVTLLGNLAEEIRNNAGDEDALNELADSIESDAAELATAITSNTVASGESGAVVAGDPQVGPGPDDSGANPNEVPGPSGSDSGEVPAGDSTGTDQGGGTGGDTGSGPDSGPVEDATDRTGEDAGSGDGTPNVND